MALALQDIPLSVKDHFGSERTSNLLREVSRKAQIVSPGTIPGAIYSLILKDVTAHDFIESLSEDFGLSKPRALAVAKEIKERVLEPVRRDLFRWGIDISAIDVRGAPDLESLKIEEPEEEKGGVKIPLATFGEKSSVTVPIAPSAPEKPVAGYPPFDKSSAGKQLPVTGSGPLIIHTEGGVAPAIAKAMTDKPAGKEKKRPFGGFSLGFGLFKKKEGTKHESPVTARLEMPTKLTTDDPSFDKSSAGRQRLTTSKKSLGKEERRTVNYSEYRTPLTPLGEPENILKKETKPIETPKIVERSATKASVAPPVTESSSPKKFFWFKADGERTGAEGQEKSREKERPPVAVERPVTVPPEKAVSPMPADGPTLEGNKVDLRSITNNQKLTT